MLLNQSFLSKKCWVTQIQKYLCDCKSLKNFKGSCSVFIFAACKRVILCWMKAASLEEKLTLFGVAKKTTMKFQDL